MNPSSMVTTTLLLLVAAGLSTSWALSSGNSIENSTQATGRSYDVVYSPPDNYPSKKSGNFFTAEDVLVKREDDATPKFEPSDKPSQPKEDPPQQPPPEQVYYQPTYYDEYVPYYKPRPRYYTDDPMYKSGTSVNWNVWKGDNAQPPAQPPQPPNSKGGGSPPDFTEYFMTDDAWKGDPCSSDQMVSMMAMMNQMQNRPKFGGLLSKLTQDPGLLLMAFIVPLSMVLAAVLPTLVNMAMNGGIPTITTTATGNAANGRSLDSTEFLSPVLQTITTFGARTFDNPDCVQRIFCQVTRGPPAVNGTESRSFQKALYTASKLIDSNWLEDFGVKTLFDSMGDGDCEKIPCSTDSPKPKSDNKSKKS